MEEPNEHVFRVTTMIQCKWNDQTKDLNGDLTLTPTPIKPHRQPATHHTEEELAAANELLEMTSARPKRRKTSYV